MGFRFQRRLKIFGGLGLNFSKTGISWSVRGSAGSFGPKGYRIRTGIKGLQYVKGYKKSKSISKNEGFSWTGFISLIISIGLVCYFTSTRAFNNYLLIILSILAIIIIISVVFIIVSFKRYNQRSNSNSQLIDNDVQDQEIILDKYENSNTIATNYNKITNVNLDFSIILSLENLCSEIWELLNEAYNEQEIVNLARNKFDNLKGGVIYDFCRVFYYLNLSIYNSGKERDILLIACGYFYNPRATQSILNKDNNIYNQLVESLNNIMDSGHPLGLDREEFPFVLPELFKNNKSLFVEYKSKLLEFAGLTTTVDFELTKNESKILETIRNL